MEESFWYPGKALEKADLLAPVSAPGAVENWPKIWSLTFDNQI